MPGDGAGEEGHLVKINICGGWRQVITAVHTGQAGSPGTTSINLTVANIITASGDE